LVKSNNESEKPGRAVEYTKMDEPICPDVRINDEKPKLAKFKADEALPRRMVP